MHVLLTSHHAPPHIGGVENLVLAEAKALLAAGHRVTWITSDGQGAGQEPPPHERFELVRVPALHWPERWFGIAYPLFAPSLVWRVWRAVAAADVVHVHGLVFPASPLACLFARLAGKWSVCTDHGGLLQYRWSVGTLFLRFLFATVGRITARCADRLVAYNREVEALQQRLCGDAAKVAFVANPVDPTVFRPATNEQRAAARRDLGWDGVPRVLLVGRLLPHKGIDVLLEASDPEYRLVFCGPADDAMRARIAGRGAECLPPRPQHELPALYHAADVFALPSYNEGFPVVLQEALACGLPSLTSDHPAYAPYRDTPGLHFCAPRPEAVRARLRDLVRSARGAAPAERANAAAPADDAAGSWLRALLPLAGERTVRWSWLVVAALFAFGLHLVFGAVRWPVGAIGKRASSIASYHHDGPAAWHLRHYDDETRRIAAWLVAEVPNDRCVLVRGFRPGALQLLAPLLHPRLLVDVDLLAARTPPVPPFTAADGSVPIVVGSQADGLRLERR